MEEVRVEIAGIAASVRCGNRAFARELREMYKGFLSSKKPDILVEAEVMNGKETGKNGVKDALKEKDGKFFMLSDAYAAQVDGRENYAKLFIWEGKTGSMKYFMRLLYSLLGINFGAFLLHSSAFEKNGKAFVFFGPGGSGKTTVARANSRSARVINDDLVVIRKLNGAFYACGSPFYVQNFSAGNLMARIDSVYLLKKDRENYFRELSPADAISGLFGSVAFGNKSREAGEKILGLCREFVDKCNCREFHFAKETPFLGGAECG